MSGYPLSAALPCAGDPAVEMPWPEGRLAGGSQPQAGFLSAGGAQPSWYVRHGHPINAPLSCPAAELFEESGDGFCVSISRSEVFIACR